MRKENREAVKNKYVLATGKGLWSTLDEVTYTEAA